MKGREVDMVRDQILNINYNRNALLALRSVTGVWS